MTYQFKLRIVYLFLMVLGFLAMISLPLGFDQHHSGLILSTLNEFDVAMTSGKEYPFNQYGPSWTLFFYFTLLLAPANHFFLAVKLVGFLLVILSIVATYTLARYFLDHFWSLVTIGFTLITYPFFTGFLPWPSLVVMPIIPYIATVFLKFTLGLSQAKLLAKLEFFSVGFLLGITLLTRAQIGIALFLAAFLIFLCHGLKNAKISLFFCFIGFNFSLAMVLGFLQVKGWLASSVYDEFVMGFMYVLGDKSTFPFPIGTLIVVATLFIAYMSMRLMHKSATIQSRFNKIFTPVVIALLLISFTLLVVSSVRLFNRFWIGLVIVATLIFSLRFISKFKPGVNPFRNPQNVLFIFSSVALLQIWPLFDQMHTWWAITPVAILVSILIKEIIHEQKIPNVLTAAVLVSCVLITSNHAFAVFKTFTSSIEIPIKGLALNYSHRENVKEIVLINDFLNANMPRNSFVLNLCSNGNTFFEPKNFNSASRNIVFWSTMKDNQNLVRDIENSKPTYIVSCNFTPFSSQLYNYYTLQNDLINSVFNEGKIKASLSLSNSRDISILVDEGVTAKER